MLMTHVCSGIVMNPLRSVDYNEEATAAHRWRLSGSCNEYGSSDGDCKEDGLERIQVHVIAYKEKTVSSSSLPLNSSPSMRKRKFLWYPEKKP